MPKGHVAMLYGLLDFLIDPDAIVLWLTPAQAMLYGEAAGLVRWISAAADPVLGRPACAALCAATVRGHATLSLGFTSMRTFTEITGDRLLVAVPASRLEQLADDLQRTLAANTVMRRACEERKRQFGGARTSV